VDLVVFLDESGCQLRKGHRGLLLERLQGGTTLTEGRSYFRYCTGLRCFMPLDVSLLNLQKRKVGMKEAPELLLVIFSFIALSLVFSYRMFL
jgi:hypothetical protein